jgi:deaminated glutathione amidase
MSVLAAAVQLNSRADKAENVKTALEITQAAARAGAGLIVLPEYTDYMGPADGVDSAAETIPGQASRAFGDLAARLGVTLVAGSCWERSDADPRRLHNTVTVFTRSGEIADRYRKLHLFDVELDGVEEASESRKITPGDRIVNVEADGLQLGIATCYDLRFPEIFRIQTLAGARVLAIPSAFRERTGRDHWEVLLRTRAIENQCYVVAANQVGVDGRGVSYFGRSMIVDPWGIVLACAPDEPGFVLARIDLARQDRLRRDMPVLHRRRDDVYQVSEVQR